MVHEIKTKWNKDLKFGKVTEHLILKPTVEKELLEYNIFLPIIEKAGEKLRCIREQIIGIAVASERDFGNVTCV